MRKTSTLTKVLLASTIAAMSSGAAAHETSSKEGLAGYGVSSAGGTVAKNPFGQCWRASYFTPAMAIQECDPDLIPKKPAPVPVAAAPAPTPVPPPPPKVVVTKVSLEADAYFDFDKASLKPAGKARIDDEIAKLGQVDLNMVIAIGHTDSIGSEAYNQKLSVRRAQAVKDYMVSKGVPANKIEIKGMGESQPVASNATREGRAKNRRVDIEFNATQKVTR